MLFRQVTTFMLDNRIQNFLRDAVQLGSSYASLLCTICFKSIIPPLD